MLMMADTAPIKAEAAALPHPRRAPLHSRALHQLRYHAKTTLLFTLSDLKTVVFPSAAAGLLTALAAPAFNLPAPPAHALAARTAQAVLWSWLNLLPFAVDNQHRPSAIAEDAANKPWRPMPQRRLDPAVAAKAAPLLYALIVVLSAAVFRAGTPHAAALVVLGVIYNAGGGSDAGPLPRNALNGAGFAAYAAGAADVVLGGAITAELRELVVLLLHAVVSSDATARQETLAALLSGSLRVGKASAWFALIALTIGLTVQIQDLLDLVGDAARGRRSLPLVIGTDASRAVTALTVSAFSVGLAAFWRVSAAGAAPTLLLGGSVAIRTVWLKELERDRTTFVLWNCWLVAIYALPLLRMATI